MGTGKIDAPPRAIFDCILNLKEKRKFDPMFAEGYVIEKVNKQTSIVYQAFDPGESFLSFWDCHKKEVNVNGTWLSK